MKQLFIVLFVVVAGLLMASCKSAPERVPVVQLQPAGGYVYRCPSCGYTVILDVVQPPQPAPVFIPPAHNAECERMIR